MTKLSTVFSNNGKTLAVTIPAYLAKKYDIQKGDHVIWSDDKNGLKCRRLHI